MADSDQKGGFNPSYGFLLSIFLIFVLFGAFGYYYGREFRFLSRSNNQSNNSSIELFDSMDEVPNVPVGTFNYGGAPLLSFFNAQGVYDAIKKAQPQFKLLYTKPWNDAPGSAVGIQMLIDGQLSFSLSTNPLREDDYKKAQDRGFQLEQVAVAIDGVECYTTLDVSIPGLSIGQLQAIFQGKINNWKEVGGPDLVITPVGPANTTSGVIKTLLPKGASVSPRMQYIPNYTDQIRKVTSIPGAISIGSLSILSHQRSIRPIPLAAENSQHYVSPVTTDGQVNDTGLRNGTYPLVRRIFVVIRHDSAPDENAGIAYTNLLLTKEGQRLIEKAGMIPIRLEKSTDKKGSPETKVDK